MENQNIHDNAVASRRLAASKFASVIEYEELPIPRLGRFDRSVQIPSPYSFKTSEIRIKSKPDGNQITNAAMRVA